MGEDRNGQHKAKQSKIKSFGCWLRPYVWPLIIVLGVAVIVWRAYVWLQFKSQFLTSNTDPSQYVTGNLLNVLIILAVIIQALIYLKMAGQNERLISASEHSANVASDAQRAYVTAKTRLDVGQLALVIENSGNTPANDVRITYRSGYRLDSPNTETKYAEVIVHEMVDGGATYGANATVRDEIAPRRISMGAIAPRESREEIVPQSLPTAADHSGGAIKFYYWGRIDYQDMFDEPRHTLFCFFRILNEARPCETGNEIH